MFQCSDENAKVLLRIVEEYYEDLSMELHGLKQKSLNDTEAHEMAAVLQGELQDIKPIYNALASHCNPIRSN